MYTQCPECSSIFEVTATDLAVAGGFVRCGQCAKSFDALNSLSDSPASLDADSAAKAALDKLKTEPGTSALPDVDSAPPVTAIEVDAKAGETESFESAEQTGSGKFSPGSEAIPPETDSESVAVADNASGATVDENDRDEMTAGEPADNKIEAEHTATDTASSEAEQATAAPAYFDDDEILLDDAYQPPYSEDDDEFFEEEALPDTGDQGFEDTLVAAADEIGEADTAADRDDGLNSFTDDEPESVTPQVVATAPGDEADAEVTTSEPDEDGDTEIAEDAPEKVTETESADESALFSLPLPELTPLEHAEFGMLPEKLEGGEAACNPSAQAQAQPNPWFDSIDTTGSVAAAAGPARATDAYDAEDARDLRDYLSAPKNRLTSAAWIGGSVIMALLLLGQIVHRHRGNLVIHPRLGPMVSSLYGVVGADLQPNWQINDYKVIGQARLFLMPLEETGDLGDAVDDETTAIRFVAIISNGANLPQPAPIVRLTLRDRWGDPTGMRDFSPPEYRQDRAMIGQLLEPGQRLRVVLNLYDLGSEAVGFDFDMCLPDGAGTLRCADEDAG